MLTRPRGSSDVAHDVAEETRRRLDLLLACERDPGLRLWVLSRCTADFEFWRDSFVWASSPELGRAVPYLAWDFQTAAQLAYLGLDGYRDPSGRRQPMIVVKSRETGGSFAMLSAALWEWLFGRSATHVVCSLNEAEVDDARGQFDTSLFGKLRFMIRHLPSWMLPGAYRVAGKARGLDSFKRLVNPETDCAIIGVSTSPDGLRGKRGVRVFVDEANAIPFLPALLESASAVAPVCLLSSVKGRHTPFARIYHGEAGAELGKRGAWGWLPFRWHYSDRPDRDPRTEVGALWVESKRRSTPPDVWQQEFECSFTSSMPGRIWGPYLGERVVLESTPSRFDVVAEGWDFGRFSYTACVHVGYRRADDSYTIIDCAQWADGIAADIGVHLGTQGWRTRTNPNGQSPHYRVGDIAGASRGGKTRNGRKVREVASWMDALREDADVIVRGQRLEINESIDYVRDAAREGRLFVGPRAARRDPEQPSMPSALEVLQGYHYDTKGKSPEDYQGDTPAPAKDHYSHLADAIQHAVWVIEHNERARAKAETWGRAR